MERFTGHPSLRLDSPPYVASDMSERINTNGSRTRRDSISFGPFGPMALLLAASTLSTAGRWNTSSLAALDNTDGAEYGQRASFASATGWHLEADLHHWTLGALSGIPRTSRTAFGLEAGKTIDIAWTRLELSAGVAELPTPESWVASAGIEVKPPKQRKIRFGLEARSSTLDGPYAQGVRSSTAQATMGWDGESTWAEAGFRHGVRQGGEHPLSGRPVNLPDNEIQDAWIWAARSIGAHWVLGASTGWANSSAETHQATGTSNGTLLWAHYPYRTPHDELSFGAIAQCQYGPFQAKAEWPFWSRSWPRVESPTVAEPAWYYRLEHDGLARLSARIDGRTSQRRIGFELSASSRPYTPGAWFTSRAYNRYAATLELELVTTSSQETTR